MVAECGFPAGEGHGLRLVLVVEEARKTHLVLRRQVKLVAKEQEPVIIQSINECGLRQLVRGQIDVADLAAKVRRAIFDRSQVESTRAKPAACHRRRREASAGCDHREAAGACARRVERRQLKFVTCSGVMIRIAR